MTANYTISASSVTITCVTHLSFITTGSGYICNSQPILVTTGLVNDLQGFIKSALVYLVFCWCSGVSNVHIMQEFLPSVLVDFSFYLASKPRQEKKKFSKCIRNITHTHICVRQMCAAKF